MTDRRGEATVRIDCERAHGVLEKQMLALPLTSDEREQLSRHLTECRDCNAFSIITARLKQFAPRASAERYRELASGALERHHAKRRRGKIRFAVASMVATAAVALLIVSTFHGKALWKTTPDKDRAALASSISACEPQEPITVSGGAITVAFCEHTKAAPPVQTARGIEVHLLSGVIAARVERRPYEEHRFSVVTPEGRVSVKGTVFAVESAAGETSVHVIRGVVEAVPDAAARRSVLSVSAGQSARMGDDRPHALDSSISLIVDQMLGKRDGFDSSNAIPRTDPTAMRAPLSLDAAPANQVESSGYWTFWFDRDDPTGNGDAESLSAFVAEGFPVCSEPVMVECRTAADHVDWRQTGERLVCRPERGAFCLNEEQADGLCEDYEVRFFCNRGGR